MKMHIFAVMPSYRPEEYSGNVGGGEISNRILLEGLAARGHEVTVVTWNAGGFGSGSRQGVRVQELGGSHNSRLSRLMTLARFRGLARDYLKTLQKPDVIVCGTEGLGVALELTRNMSVPVGLFMRAFENFEAQNGVVESLARRAKTTMLGDYGPAAVAEANFLLPNSKFLEEYCFDRIGKEVPSTVIYPPLHWKTGAPFDVTSIQQIAMVGTSEKKGIKLVEYLASQFPKVDFRVLGTSETMQQSGTLPHNLKFLGWSDIREEFSCKADAVLVPSLWAEPFGRVAIEALACGKPPLVSDIGGLPEAVSYEPSLCLQPGNEAAWCEALTRLIENPDPFVMAAKRAASSIDRFSAKQQVERLEQALILYVNRFSYS